MKKGVLIVNYLLKHFDTVLMKFSADAQSSAPDYKILWINEEQKKRLPLSMTPDERSLEKWLKHRAIPKNRAYVHNFLAKCGLSINQPMNIIAVSRGLSLNDCYWVVEEGFEGTFAENNLYDNRFSNILASLVFTGYGSSVRSSWQSSPEFTTNGMLPKCWRRIQGTIYLYKGGTSGAANTGFEPYSEYYAYQIAKVMGIAAVPYNISQWKGNLCSTCELFTSKKYSYVPAGDIVEQRSMSKVREYYRTLGGTFEKALEDMLVFDALICNVDRHFGNFGFLADNMTNEIAKPAPLFDHGNSLFNFAWAEDWDSEKDLENYIDTLQPRVYDDFIETAREVLSARHRKGLHKLLQFHFVRHVRYNLPAKRLKMIERQIQKRAGRLLEAADSI